MVQNPMSGHRQIEKKKPTALGSIMRILFGLIGAFIILSLFFGCVGVILGDGEQPEQVAATKEIGEVEPSPEPAPEPEPEPSPEPEPEVTEEPAPEPEPSPESESVLPDGAERCDVQEATVVDGETSVWVYFDARDGFTRSAKQRMAQEDTALCLQVLALEHPDADWYHVEGLIDGTNAYGEDVTITWAYHLFDSDTVERINWDNIETRNIWGLAEAEQLYRELV